MQVPAVGDQPDGVGDVLVLIPMGAQHSMSPQSPCVSKSSAKTLLVPVLTLHTVTPKTVPMFGSFVLHMKWCV